LIDDIRSYEESIIKVLLSHQLIKDTYSIAKHTRNDEQKGIVQEIRQYT